MESFETILINKVDRVAIVTLNRGDVHNAFNPTMIFELTSVFGELGKDASIRAIVLTGAGKSFSAGADIKYMKASRDFTYEENHEDAVRLEGLFNTIYNCPKPVIGKINGAAFGGGVGLIAVCDIVIAIESAKFAFSEVNLGILPAVISPYVMLKIGANASRYFLTGERFEAYDAKQMGLIHEIATNTQELNQKVADIIDQLFSSSPAAMIQIKTLIDKNRNTDFEELRKYCINSIAEIRTTSEGREGLEAFLEKRRASWRLDQWKGRSDFQESS
ncbi:MAG: enoyl-CoA hydratase/isomerase family protein [Candidatus Heimdallarchaeota archaeon]|nr:MAG: enoyl-CoA hydratase/isomerase family protein [Candidatus Heimdallarchaeota archaeon]